MYVCSSAAPKFFGLQLNHSCYLTFNVCSLKNTTISLTVTAYFKGEVFTNLLSWISEPLFLYYSTESLTQLDFSTEVRWQKRTSRRHATVCWCCVQLAILGLLLFVVGRRTSLVFNNDSLKVLRWPNQQSPCHTIF